ncbi:MAG: nucleotidyltransferase domain-containing protein [Candidatus Hydrogenedentes bacterium]|nr:nucleotidyltransferase domain-containing protein [Candidatus Hydrogenedentota bacterium]
MAKRSANAVIQKIVRRIVDEFHPEQVILFGSHARGEAGPDSDIDLLVVMSFKGSKREKQVALRGIIPDNSGPVDVIVTSPEDYRWRKDVVGTIEWPASHEGKVLYGRV